MANNPYSVTVTVEAAPRGSSEAQAYLKFAAAQCAFTWSWGLQPATGLIEWVSPGAQAPILPLSQLTIEFRDRVSSALRHTFYGIAKSVVPVVDSAGRSTHQEFVDSREFLQWDLVYCCFNKRDSKIVNGQWVRRYWHILPWDFNTMSRTYTNAPLTARQILDYMFGSATVESPWVRAYVNALDFPVYDVDCLRGKKLGTAITELSEALGCVFTVMGGRYRLVWCVKGLGTAPAFPANSDNRRAGTSLSGNPTRLRVLGDRDLYQVMNMELEPDWLPAWVNFFDLDRLSADLFDHEGLPAPINGLAAGTPFKAIPDDTGGMRGRFLADALARTITVGQYAMLRDARDSNGAAFRDFRRFGGRSRLAMPAALYIQAVLFRAFRPPSNFRLRNVYGQWMTLWSLELQDRALVEVTHDPVTGVMSWQRDVISAGNGYAIAQGYLCGQDGYKTLRPENFKFDDFMSEQKVWQHLSFQIDDSGDGTKFVIFDAPVFQGDLITQCLFDGVEQDYPALNAVPQLKPPPVRASLVFAAEPFSYVAGEGTRDDVQNVSGLAGEFVMDGRAVTELAFADGYTASDKAEAIVESLLNRQFVVGLGGYRVQGINGTQLTSMLDRVTVHWGEDGATEDVDFCTERSRAITVGTTPGGRRTYYLHVPAERDYDRREQLLQLLPGQRELKEQARQYQMMAAALQQNPKMVKTLLEMFSTAFGMDAMPQAVFIDPIFEPSGPLAAGTPLFKEADEDVMLSPQAAEEGDVTPETPVFVGVTVLHNEPANGPVRVTASGNNGVLYARVQGPVEVDDGVGLKDSVMSYLQSSPKLAVGTAQAAIEDDSIALIPVRVTGGGGGGDPVWLP